MKDALQLKSISDDELLERLSKLLSQSRRVEAELVAHIGEVDERRIYAKKAASSMFSYCVETMNLSESEAYLRITVARASRKHPVLLDMLADGRLHLTGIAKLAQHLTDENRDGVLARAVGKTKRQIDELVAELAPKPDVAATMRKLPKKREKKKLKSVSPQLRPDGVAPSPPAPAPAKPPVVVPTAPSRYKVQFTAGAEFHDKLERLRALMRSTIPDGDIGAIIEEAVTEKLERLEAKRFGKTKSPRKNLEETDTTPSSRKIPAAVRRAVCARDQNQCTFVDESGRRCAEKSGLEFHHVKPFGRGGDHSPANIRILCRSHNAYMAERDYGKDVMNRYRNGGHAGGRVSEPFATYTFGNRDVIILQRPV
jgi:hypothetical protein